MAGRFSLGGLVLKALELACPRIDRENCDAIVPAVGGVNEPAGRMNFNFRAGAGVGKALGQSANGLGGLQFSAWAVVRADRERRGELVDDVSEPSQGMKCQVSRA